MIGAVLGIVGAVNGYKTIIGIAVYAVGAILEVFSDEQAAKPIKDLGLVIGSVGAGHKLDKVKAR